MFHLTLDAPAIFIATKFFRHRKYTGANPINKGGIESLLVYLPLVIFLNFIVNFLLILTSNRLCGYPYQWIRSALAAACGGLYGGICLLPIFRFLGSFWGRTVFLICVSWIAFGQNRAFIHRGSVFLLLNLATTSIVMGFRQNNSGILLLSGAVLFLLCRCCRGICSKENAFIPVKLRWNGKTISLTALRDTGNLLRDPVTGEQILIAGGDVAQELNCLTAEQLRQPVEAVASGTVPGLRLIPYRSVGQSSGMLPALRFHNVTIGHQNGSHIIAFAPDSLSQDNRYRMLTGGTISCAV